MAWKFSKFCRRLDCICYIIVSADLHSRSHLNIPADFTEAEHRICTVHARKFPSFKITGICSDIISILGMVARFMGFRAKGVVGVQ